VKEVKIFQDYLQEQDYMTLTSVLKQNKETLKMTRKVNDKDLFIFMVDMSLELEIPSSEDSIVIIAITFEPSYVKYFPEMVVNVCKNFLIADD